MYNVQCITYDVLEPYLRVGLCSQEVWICHHRVLFIIHMPPISRCNVLLSDIADIVRVLYWYNSTLYQQSHHKQFSDDITSGVLVQNHLVIRWHYIRVVIATNSSPLWIDVQYCVREGVVDSGVHSLYQLPHPTTLVIRVAKSLIRWHDIRAVYAIANNLSPFVELFNSKVQKPNQTKPNQTKPNQTKPPYATKCNQMQQPNEIK